MFNNFKMAYVSMAFFQPIDECPKCKSTVLFKDENAEYFRCEMCGHNGSGSEFWIIKSFEDTDRGAQVERSS